MIKPKSNREDNFKLTCKVVRYFKIWLEKPVFMEWPKTWLIEYGIYQSLIYWSPEHKDDWVKPQPKNEWNDDPVFETQDVLSNPGRRPFRTFIAPSLWRQFGKRGVATDRGRGGSCGRQRRSRWSCRARRCHRRWKHLIVVSFQVWTWFLLAFDSQFFF